MRVSSASVIDQAGAGGRRFGPRALVLLSLALGLAASACQRTPDLEPSACPLEFEEFFHNRVAGFSVEIYKGWGVRHDNVQMLWAVHEVDRTSFYARFIAMPNLKKGDVESMKTKFFEEAALSPLGAGIIDSFEVEISGRDAFQVEFANQVQVDRDAESRSAPTDADLAMPATADLAMPAAADLAMPAAADLAMPAAADLAMPAAADLAAPGHGYVILRSRMVLVPRRSQALQFAATWESGNSEAEQAVDCMYESLYLWF